jgi:hypothetical protein
MVNVIQPDELDHPKRLNSEQGVGKTMEFPFWAGCVVAKKGSWWFISKNMLKIKVIEIAEGSLTVLTVWAKSPWLLHKTQNKFPQPAINDG